MISSTSLFIIVPFLWNTKSSALHERYVKPDNSSLSCPDQPCFTLYLYTQQTATYFTTGSTFLFLPGNHTLQTTINLTDISNLKFKRNAEQDSTIHGNGGKILCVGVINLTIDGLTLKTTYLEVFESQGIVISNSTFVGNGTLTKKSTSALTCSNSNITVINSHFKGNIGSNGGAMRIEVTNLDIINSTFFKNMAYFYGGAIYAKTSSITVRRTLMQNFNEIAVIFSGNSAADGGAIYLNGTTAIFSGALILFQDNSAKSFGGGIYAIKSSLTFQSSTSLFSGNYANRVGGAINMVYGTIQLLSKNTIFTDNSANYSGGALYGLSTTTNLDGNITFSHNSAKTGGGMYFVGVSLKITSGMKLNASFNNASKYGGAIYYRDTLTRYQCTAYLKYKDKVPYCFIQLIGTELTGDTSMAIHSYYNTAGVDGIFIYGGSLDRCQLKSTSLEGTIDYSTDYNILESKINIILQPNNSVNAISSYPYRLCSCRNNNSICGNSIIHINIHRGQEYTVSLYAIAQAGNRVLTTVTARTSDSARLESSQTYQKLSQQYKCSSLVYNLYSTEDHEKLELHPDGSCDKTSLSFSVTFLPCPPGFIQSSYKCICEQRLMKYTTTCTIYKNISIMRNNDARFWMNASYENGTYHGLILYKTCPVEYCKKGNINISLDMPDMQCALNRKGVLCGACVTNHSLMLGSSRCHVCPNTYLALLLPFAAAGIALLVLSFLSILKTTVVTGMINSVILYANIVQVNRRLFFPINTVNVLTIFIAWMNLDLGFETCFYNGMTAYAKTWLQFAFPIYIWILITLIIITSRYSVRVSRLIGHNPIAALNTLVLMSYTKILKIIIDVYSSAQLEYPDNKTVTVWLKDGNVPYLHSWHLLLTVVTTLVVVFLFLPYTLLLLLGYKLYRFSGRKHMRWLNRLKPLLDSYYGPYKTHTRYWTGFLLLVRCVLYIVFSFGDASTNHFAIIITFFIIVLAFTLIPGRIYTNSHINIIESLVYSNLIVLSGVILSLDPSAALVYSLVGMVFAIMVCIILYPFFMHYTFESLRMKIRTKISASFHHMKIPIKKEETSATETTPKKVSTTVIELREPLLEN